MNEQVELGAFADGAFGVGDAGFGGKVGLERFDCNGDLCREGAQAVLPAGEKNQVVALRGELAGKDDPDTAGGTCNQRDRLVVN